MARKAWLPADIEILRELYPDHTSAYVGQVLGRKPGSIWAKARELGIDKSQAFFDSAKSGRIQRGQKDPRLKATQFKKGMQPWNKGKPGTTGHHPNTKATQFKKGRAPEESRNYLPIGSLRLTKDGYLERKVTDDHPVPTRRWVAEHRLVWERAHGPIPKGHIVRFKTGMKTAIEAEVTLERLECITRAENANRNSFRRFGPEMAQLYQLKGAIARQLNRISKEAQEREMACTGKS